MTELEILYSQRALTKQINDVEPASSFIVDKIFNVKEINESELIDIEIINGSSRLAEFSRPDDPNPKPVQKKGKVVKQVKVPKTWESKTFTTQELKNLNAIGTLYKSDAIARRQAISDKVSFELQDLKNRAIRRRTQIGCSILETGSAEVTQDDGTYKFNFGFANNKQLFTLAGDDLWDAAASNPIVQAQTWKRRVKGADIALLGSDAASAWLANEKVLKYLDNNQTKVGMIDLTAVSKYSDTAVYLGTVNGIQFWEVVETYENAVGNEIPMISADRAIVVNSKRHFRLHLAPAHRLEGGNLSSYFGEFLLQPFENKYKTILEWTCEQKSLPAIWDIKAVNSIKVLA